MRNPTGETALENAFREAALRKATAEGTITLAVRDVIAERQRQIKVEGFDAKHDDVETNGELAGAAACYALNGIVHAGAKRAIEKFWPWEPEWWKPGDRRRDLVKAGALILAEIERLDRQPINLPRGNAAET